MYPGARCQLDAPRQVLTASPPTISSPCSTRNLIACQRLRTNPRALRKVCLQNQVDSAVTHLRRRWPNRLPTMGALRPPCRSPTRRKVCAMHAGRAPGVLASPQQRSLNWHRELRISVDVALLGRRFNPRGTLRAFGWFAFRTFALHGPVPISCGGRFELS